MTTERPHNKLPEGYLPCLDCEDHREINIHLTGGSGICQTDADGRYFAGGEVWPCLNHWHAPGRSRTEAEKYLHGHGCLTGDISLSAPTEDELMAKWNKLQTRPIKTVVRLAETFMRKVGRIIGL